MVVKEDREVSEVIKKIKVVGDINARRKIKLVLLVIVLASVLVQFTLNWP